MQIKRIESLRDCGIFADYRHASANDFARINIIYGPNGVGKTSLARALYQLGVKEGAHEKVSPLVGNDSTSRSSSGEEDPCFERILVFSEDYVEDNHHFARDADPHIPAVLTLDKRSADAERRLEELRPQVETKRAQIEGIKSRAKEFGRAVTKEYEQVSQKVVAALSSVGGPYRSRGSYNTRAVRQKFEAQREGWRFLSEGELAEKTKLAQSRNQDAVPQWTCNLTIRENIAEDVATALQTEPVTKVLVVRV